MLSRLTAADVTDAATNLGMTLSEDEAEVFAEISADVMASIDELEEISNAREAKQEARRTSRRATREEDPLNAVIHWIDMDNDAEGPLSGKRVAVKDSVAVAGVPLTCGSRLLRDFVPTEDSVATERLLAAGANIVATTNMDDLALSGGGDTSHFGPTLNPFDPERTAGGSSGGSAAILQYQGVDLTLGTDQGGSIRVPASWCGVIGLKPTHGLVPYTGVVATDQTFDHVGPMARRVDDLAVAMQVLAGRDTRDPRQDRGVPEVDFLGAVERDAGNGLTLGVLTQGISSEVGVEPEVLTEFLALLERLGELGVVTREVDVPEHLIGPVVSTSVAMEGISSAMATGSNGYQWHGRYWLEIAVAMRTAMPEAIDHLSPQAKVVMLLGEHLRRTYGGAIYAKAQNARPQLTAGYDRGLSDVDLLIMPTTPGIPHKLVQLPPRELVQRGWGVLANTSVTNLTGHPAISLPLCQVNSVPVGVMVVARRFEDDRLIEFAAMCEREIGWSPNEPSSNVAATTVQGT